MEKLAAILTAEKGHCYYRFTRLQPACGFQVPERPRRLARPRTSPFHGGNAGSNPAGDAKKIPLPSISGRASLTENSYRPPRKISEIQ